MGRGDEEKERALRGEGSEGSREAQRPGPSVVALLLPVFIMGHSSIVPNIL